MDLLRRFFPHAFAVQDIKSLLITILIYVVANAVVGFVIGILAKFPLIGFFFGILGWLVSIYFFAAIVIAILRFLHIL